MTSNIPHRWRDCIVAWAEGRTVQFKYAGHLWLELAAAAVPRWDDPYLEWRIKPEPRKPREQWVNVFASGHKSWHETSEDAAALRLVSTTAIIECIHYIEVIE